MGTRVFAALAAVAIFSLPVRAVDAGLAGLVMPGARVLAGVNVGQSLVSPFGQYVLSRLQGNEPALRQLEDLTGFDPRRDVREVLLASTGEAAPGRPAWLALARGSFDAARIAAAAGAKGAGVENYNGVTVLNNARSRQSLALLAPDLAVAGSPDEVRAAIDRRANPIPMDALLAARAAELSATQDVWFVSLAPPPLSGLRVPDPTLQGLLNSGLLNGIQQTSAGVRFGATVDVTAEAIAATNQDAATLASLIRLLASLAQRSGTGNAPASLLQSLSVTTEGSAVRLALSVPEATLEQFAAAPRARPRAPRRYRTR